MHPHFSSIAWQKRQQQWDRFHEWERSQRDATTPADRLAAIGTLLELHYRASPHPSETPCRDQQLIEQTRGVQMLHQRLAALSSRR